jgi:uncharacterized membrane protein
MTSLIRADDHWSLWAVLLVAAAAGLLAERTRWGARLSAAVVSIAVTFALSNLGVIPVDAPAYDVVWGYFVPLAIPLLLLKADLARILREAGPTLFAFAAGAVGTLLGALVAWRLVPLGDEGWRFAGIFSATYVGGSMNFAATSKALGLEAGDLLTAGVAADNLVMTIYFLSLFAMAASAPLQRAFPRRAGRGEGAGGAAAVAGDASRIRLSELAAALALSAVLCAAGRWAAGALGQPAAAILVITALAVALATLFPRRLSGLSGATEAGTLLMQVFFAVIGASANVAVVLRAGPALFLFAAVILAVHLAFILAAGKVMKLDLAEILVASNANVGGPTTAAAMANARGWDTLVTPAVLCGTLGYAIATFLGTALGTWLR